MCVFGIDEHVQHREEIFTSVKRYLCVGLTCLVAIDISST